MGLPGLCIVIHICIIFHVTSQRVQKLWFICQKFLWSMPLNFSSLFLIFCFCSFSLPLKATYKQAVSLQRIEIEEMRQDEALQLPEDLDYFAISASLSQEVREKLNSHRPQTVRSWHARL